MDRDEARSVLASALTDYRRMSYDDLRARVGTIETHEIIGPSGVQYQIEVDIRWDSPREQNAIRVGALIDDGRLLSALRPVCIDFIVGQRNAD